MTILSLQYSKLILYNQKSNKYLLRILLSDLSLENDQMHFPLKWLLFNRWLWIIIFSLSTIVIGPLIALLGILALPMQYRGLATFLIVFGWGIAAGYKDWIVSKRQKEKLKIKL